jgi:hypothetical protein
LRIPPIEAWFGARFPKEMEISKAFLDLLRSAAKKDPELQATRDAGLRKNENVVTEHFGQLKAIEVA